jgi:acyl homoserine lactone synthase
MIDRVDFSNLSDHIDAITEMHRLRYQVFHKRLGWDVAVSGDMEIDEFDALGPTYLIHRTETGAVGGCTRLLPTTGPYMLRDTFPALADSDIPATRRMWEGSRFAIAAIPGMSKGPCGLSVATSELFAASVEFGLDLGLTDIVAVVDLRMERILRRAGWPMRRMGKPMQVGIASAVAGLLTVSQSALDAIKAAGGIDGPVTTYPNSHRIAA